MNLLPPTQEAGKGHEDFNGPREDSFGPPVRYRTADGFDYVESLEAAILTIGVPTS